MSDIDFVELEQKTSAEFVKRIKLAYENVGTSPHFEDEREIKHVIEENEYLVKVLLCFSGSIERHEYWKSTEKITFNRIAWTDIDKFFSIPFGMEYVKK